MQINPAEEWQRLTEHYRGMLDSELEQLADNYGDLTETAQQVLRTELLSRGLDDPCAKKELPPNRGVPNARQWADPADLDATDNNDEDGPSVEFTWKTLLCECDDKEQAWQIREMLRRAGIESWVEQPGSRYSFGISSPRVVVAADQIEEARQIAAMPIPQEIVDLFRADVPEFEAPQCPNCGAEDPVLESAEPANSWLCEACGAQWTEPALDAEGKPE
jgi:hypothetical protein